MAEKDGASVEQRRRTHFKGPLKYARHEVHLHVGVCLEARCSLDKCVAPSDLLMTLGLRACTWNI